MANTRGATMTKVNAGTTTDAGSVLGSVLCFTETVTFAEQASGDTIEIAKLPKGAIVLYGVITASASAGASATIAIGTAASAAKYRAAATFTTADTPTLFGKAAALNTPLSAEETVIITVGAAALPSSGTLNVTLVYAVN